MNETLKKELKSYFKGVDERKKHVETVLNNAKVDLGDIKDKLEKNAELKLHSILKGFINKKKFTGRNNSRDRIFLDKDEISYVEFKHKTKRDVSLIGKYKTGCIVNEWFPTGFIKVIAEVDKILGEFKEIDVTYTDEKKINLKIAIVDDDKLDEGKIKKVIIKDEKEYSNTKSNISFNTKDLYVYGDAKYQFLTEDMVYNAVKGMLEVKMEWKQKVMERIKAIENKLNKLLDEGYNKILVAARLIGDGK